MPTSTGMLADRVILVTGASRGIGAAAARLFASEGARVVATARGEPELKALVDEIEAAGGRAAYVSSDAGNPDSAATVVSWALDHYGRLDGAFNNAGLGQSAIPTAEITEADFDAVTAINMRSVWSYLKYEIDAMLRTGGGSIVNNSSLGGFLGVPGGAGYAATKHAVVGLTKSAAGEYAIRGIRVNAIAPGTTGTEMIHEWNERAPEALAAVLARTPIGRMAEPREIAEAALWLLSDRSSFVSGVLLPIDGAMTAVV